MGKCKCVVRLKVRRTIRGGHEYIFKIGGYKPTIILQATHANAPKYGEYLKCLFQQPLRQ